MTVPRDLDYGCACGALRGTARGVAPAVGNRLVCMCDDCQAYAAYLGRDDIVDDAGGTEVFQLTPNRLTFASGTDQLRCVRLTAKGLMRWYADCCKTPLANTLAARRVAFAGVPVMALHPAEARDEALGPVRARINGRYARPDATDAGHARAPLGLIGRSLRLFAAGMVRRAYAPSPFFDADGHHVCEPGVLSAAERDALTPAHLRAA